LPLKRARQLCGPRIKSANLWLGDGRVQSAVHWDGHDNLLLQLEAVWKSTGASGAPDNFHEVILGDDAAVLAPSSGEEPTPPRHRAGVAATAWRSTRTRHDVLISTQVGRTETGPTAAA